MQTILVPVDGSHGANQAARFAAGLARDSGARLILLHVYDAPTAAAMGLARRSTEEYERALEQASAESFEAAHQAMSDLAPRVDHQVTMGHPANEIVLVAEKSSADLIVMGSRGRSEIASYLLGSVSERVLRHAPCPVTVMR
jgi:nucleotide-binding universal stress UspA family protein